MQSQSFTESVDHADWAFSIDPNAYPVTLWARTRRLLAGGVRMGTINGNTGVMHGPTRRPAGLTTREKRERKAERLREWAEKREAKADEAYNGVKSITERIPFGQPILVGHHSERGARADQRRIESGMDRFVEHLGKADDMRSRAENIERQARTSIYSDDPDAVDALTAKIEKLEARRDAMKARNAEFKKAHKAELKAMGSAFQRDRAMPHQGYELTNLGATIRTAKKRLAELSTPEGGRVLVARYAGECRKCGGTVEQGDTVLYFKRAKAVEHQNCAA
jgi:hypothetical protein